ncbi:helix-turn-helix domain-containing protein [Sandaracinus amylolyticus]|uniref:HTH merR-type domain-containing protein n=1 Tax=Sandaracinus amylolyticus TaxID=927083 RepID=A0A0F6YGP2_9BACT|nr:helix-turn-helix domain-containing protein [Sandaracinus amylolyticus]AKF04913.1 hypothetical protein DB32_002062 [Sandaracinus amylolyticus]
MDDVPEALEAAVLAKRLGVSTRTLRAWMQAGALPRPRARGHLTRFDRKQIVIAYAVAALRRDGVPLPHIARFLTNKTDAELREIGGLPAPREPAALPPPPPTRALPSDGTPSAPARDGAGRGSGIENVVSTESLAVQSALAPRDEPSSTGVPIGAVWRRIELLPGLELHVRADAPPFVHGIAAAIAAGRFSK